MRNWRSIWLVFFFDAYVLRGVESWSGSHIPLGGSNPSQSSKLPTSLTRTPSEPKENNGLQLQFLKLMAASLIAGSSLVVGSGVSYADEIGVERDAPTLFTGETIEICVKRGPLGACQETVIRTEQNDNDKAKNYFKDPSETVKAKMEAALARESGEGNSLVDKLRQQTAENKEKNDLDVQRKTFENDQSATFGPFDRQVVILNADGKSFTVLQSPQAMRLKKVGFIDGRHFVKQPTEEDIEAALEPEEGGLATAILGIFGGESD